jgi:hypothetical protein
VTADGGSRSNLTPFSACGASYKLFRISLIHVIDNTHGAPGGNCGPIGMFVALILMLFRPFVGVGPPGVGGRGNLNPIFDGCVLGYSVGSAYTFCQVTRTLAGAWTFYLMQHVGSFACQLCSDVYK